MQGDGHVVKAVTEEIFPHCASDFFLSMKSLVLGWEREVF